MNSVEAKQKRKKEWNQLNWMTINGKVKKIQEDIVRVIMDSNVKEEDKKREAFLQVRGLKRKERKTRRLTTAQGFSFLGFWRQRRPALGK